ncbi:hypothetical protein [Pseudomonas sp.]|uniref:hypothetical protein n=1 Tax=Pseudomonas sp. TaxID=306 RepID=UPI00290991E0|nr:hypothetical protein [Pseudomonas sp.]MDU4254421.1 hypothetical protein [Pseudomonas sp.]
MLLVSLHPYDPVADTVGSGAMLRMRDSDVRTVLDRLSAAGGDGLHVRLNAPNKAGGAPHEVQLAWNRDYAAFSCMLDGKQAGLLPYDEMAGSLGKVIPEQARTCRICLCSEVDLWRSGVMDVATGTVHVYTQTKGLASLGAYAYFTDVDDAPGLDGLYVELDPGEPATGTLRVPSHALHSIQNAAYTPPEPQASDARQALDRLAEMGKNVSKFQETMRGGSKPTMG